MLTCCLPPATLNGCSLKQVHLVPLAADCHGRQMAAICAMCEWLQSKTSPSYASGRELSWSKDGRDVSTVRRKKIAPNGLGNSPGLQRRACEKLRGRTGNWHSKYLLAFVLLKFCLGL